MYGFCTPCWCLGSDFNAVRFPNEKLVGGSDTASMRYFVAFIQN